MTSRLIIRAVSSPMVPAVRSSKLIFTSSTALSALSTPVAFTRHWQSTRGAPNDCPAPRVTARLRPSPLASSKWLSEVIPGLYPRTRFGMPCRQPRANIWAGAPSRCGTLWPLDHIGPLPATVEDCVLMLGAIAGPDPGGLLRRQVSVPDYTASLDQDIARLRISVLDGPPLPRCSPMSVWCLLGHVMSLRLSVSNWFPS